MPKEISFKVTLKNQQTGEAFEREYLYEEMFLKAWLKGLIEFNRENLKDQAQPLVLDVESEGIELFKWNEAAERKVFEFFNKE